MIGWAGVFAIFLLGCSYSEVNKDKIFEEKILVAMRTAHNGGTLDIVQLTDFDWDKMFVFHPYTPSYSIFSSLGFEWNDPAVDRIAVQDGASLLLFTEKGSVMKSLSIPNNEGLFLLKDKDYVEKDFANFEVSVSDIEVDGVLYGVKTFQLKDEK